MSAMVTEKESGFDSIQRRVRLVLLLEASRDAGIEPLATRRLHFIAYLVNVLSPVWDLPSVRVSGLRKSGSVLKRKEGPFYPQLQRDLDRLVGMGVAHAEELRYERLDAGHFRLEGSYRVDSDRARPILSKVYSFKEEAHLARFIRELVLALSALSDDEIDEAVTEDATYTDPVIGLGNVVDFGEWGSKNYSAAAAERAGDLVNSGVGASASEKVHLYVRHLRKRLQGGK